MPDVTDGNTRGAWAVLFKESRMGHSWRRSAVACRGALAACAASQARAATNTYGPTSHDNGGAGYGNGAAGAFAVPQFDDRGGALMPTKITLAVQIDGTGGQHEFDNEGSAGAFVTLGIGATVRVKGPLGGSQLIVIPDAYVTATGWVDADSEPGGAGVDFVGTDCLSIRGGAVSDVKSGSRTAAASLAPYIGTGDVAFVFDGAGTSTSGTGVLPSPGARRVTTETTNFSFATTLQYEYVPEPATALPLSLGGLGLVRRRWRR